MTKRVAVYARVSTNRQAENEISISDQVAHARRHCSAKGWQVVHEFVDAGASARDDKRTQFQAMIDAACVDPSPFDVVLVHSLSRFFRDSAGHALYKLKLQKHGVSLVSITQDFGEGASADFAETILAAADQYTSAETAKHVTRTMLENARQGFWNGARPPFGYRTVAVEQRGQRTKKHLEIEPREAETVRLIFRLFLEGDGTLGPLGIKQIASWLNARAIHNALGKPFYTGTVHKILTRESYAGVHYYNRRDSRSSRPRPKEEWIAVAVPAIIPKARFELAQKRLHERRPSLTPPRISNSEVLLTGIVRCESCGGRLMVRTGKGGRYRYYACASNRLKGSSTCGKPIGVPEGELNQLVIGALANHLLTAERLPVLLREAQKHRRSLASGGRQRRAALQKQLNASSAQIQRLYAALADGLVSDTAMFRENLKALEAKQEETVRLLGLIDSETPAIRQVLSNGQAAALAEKLKRLLLDAPSPLQRRYVHGLVSDILVDHEKAVITGPKAAIAAAITAGTHTGQVRSLVREWRTRRDSNS